MATITTLVDRVKIYAASTGSGAFLLGPPVTAFRGSEALVDGHRYSYAVEQGSEYEYGTGEYVLSTNSLVRSPEGSSRGGAPVPFAANAQIAFTALAADYTYGDVADLRADLAAATGAGMIGTAAGGSVQEALDASSGTVISVTASVDTTGTDVGVSVVNATSTPAITLHIPTASAVNRGVLSSVDYSAFNAKVPAGAVVSSGLTQTTGKLLGRWSASTGAIQEVTIGAGLSLDGSGNLTAAAGSAVWGAITGTLSAQTDLTAALAAKAATGLIGSSGITQNTGKLLGRWAASAGVVQEVTISTGLALDGSGNLTATAAAWGGITGTLSAQTDLQSALTARALTGAVGSSGLTQTTGKLLGRWSASTGAVQEVTVSAGLAMDGSGNLSAPSAANLASNTGGQGAALVASKASTFSAPINRTVLARQNDWQTLGDVVSGTGAAGDAAKVTQAVLDMANAGGGTIWIPPNFITRVDTVIDMKPNVRLVGSNKYNSIFDVQKASSQTFRYAVDSDWASLENLCVQQNGSFTATGGFAVDFAATGTLGARVKDVLLNNVWSGVGSTITSGSVNNVLIDNVTGLGLLSVGLQLQYAVDWQCVNSLFDMVDYANNRIPILIESGTDGPFLVNVIGTKGQYGVRSQKTVGAGNAPRHAFFQNVVMDGNDDVCWSLASMHRANFDGCWSSSARTGSVGVVQNAADVIDVSWDLCNFLLSDLDGMQISGGATKISVTNSRFAGWGLAAASTYAAISCAANAATWFNVSGNKFLNDSDFAGNEYRGLVVNSGTYLGYRAQNNDSFSLTGGAGSCVVDAGTASGTKTVLNNVTN